MYLPSMLNMIVQSLQHQNTRYTLHAHHNRMQTAVSVNIEPTSSPITWLHRVQTQIMKPATRIVNTRSTLNTKFPNTPLGSLRGTRSSLLQRTTPRRAFWELRSFPPSSKSPQRKACWEVGIPRGPASPCTAGRKVCMLVALATAHVGNGRERGRLGAVN